MTVLLWHWCLFVGVASTLLYFNTLHNDLVFDDEFAIHRNRDVKGETSWLALLTNDYWGEPMISATSHKSYRLLTVASFRLNYQQHGGSVEGYHAINIAAHALCSVMVVLVTAKLSQSSKRANLIGGLTGILFAVHAIHTEAVAWVVGRAELFSCFFALLSFLSWQYLTDTLVYGEASEDMAWSSLRVVSCSFISFISTLLAMMSKELGFTVVGIIAAFGVMQILFPMFYKMQFSSRMKIYAGFLLLYIVLCGVALKLRYNLNGPFFPDFSQSKDNVIASADPTTRFYSLFYLPYFYLLLCLWPSKLAPDYSFDSFSLVSSWHDVRNVGSLCVLCALAFYLYVAIRKSTNELRVMRVTALLWMIVPYVPSSNLFFWVGFTVAERILYIPTVGFCMLVVTVFDDVLATQVSEESMSIEPSAPDDVDSRIESTDFDVENQKRREYRYTVYSIFVAICIALAVKTVSRNMEWASEETLWLATRDALPRNVKAWMHLGYNYEHSNRLDEAEKAYRKALKLMPNDYMLLSNLGSVYMRRNLYEKAVQVFKKATSLTDRSSGAHFNLGSALSQLKKFDEALWNYKQALQKEDQLVYYRQEVHYKTYMAMGNLYVDNGKRKEAIDSFQSALKTDPSNPLNPELNFRIGAQYHLSNNHAMAMRFYKQAISLGSRSRNVFNNMVAIYIDKKQYNEAIKILQDMIRMDPSDQDARNALEQVTKLSRSNR